MSTTDNLADPIISSVASVLSVPLLELYALLWRVGVVEIVEPGDSRASQARSHGWSARGRLPRTERGRLVSLTASAPVLDGRTGGRSAASA